ncbi:MAG: PAS domain S-box protein, partial [Chroococcales cyanobacterium]
MKPVTIDQANQSNILQPMQNEWSEIETHWYCKLLSSLPAPGFLCEMTEAKILYANSHFAKLVGLTTEQVIGYQVKGFAGEAREWDVLMINLARQNSLSHPKLRWQKADGTRFSVSISLQLISVENQTLILGICHEIPHQPQEDNQRMLSTLMNHFPGMVYRCRLEGKPTWIMEFVSQGCLALTGYSALDLIENAKISYQEITHPHDREKVRDAIETALAQKQAFQVEYRILTKTGQQKWVWEQGQGLFSETGNLIALEGFITDITERKRAEEEVYLLQTLTQAISEASDFEAALEVTLRQVCEATYWDYGEAWIPNEDGTVLQCSPAWYSSSHKSHLLLETLHSQSVQYEFPSSVGLPGEVWLSRKAKWLPDVSVESEFVRADLAKSFGLKAGFAVPILANDEVVAVLVFFMFQSHSQDERFVKLVSAIAAQLGGVIQRKQAEVALRESQRQLDSLINAMPGIFFSATNENGWSMHYISEGCQELTGYCCTELKGNRACSLDKITHPEDLPHVLEAIATSVQQHTPYVVEYRIRTKEGHQKWVWEKGHGVYDDAGKVVGLEGFITDITQHKWTESELRQAESNYRGIVENAIEGIFQTTPNGYYLSANPALAKIYGYDSPDDLIASLTDIEHQLYVNPQRRTEFIRLLQENDFVSEFESQVYRCDGSVIWISEKARAVRNASGTLLYYEGMVEEITERKRAKDKLTQRAFYDPLTGLSNRAMFMERLGKALSRCQNTEDSQFAVLFLDLDRFKVVNDSLGHLVGDELLIAIARRVERCVREEDLVARLGGDEFTILLENITQIEQAIAIAERIKQELNTPFSLQGHQVFTGTSIGIVLSHGQPESQGNLAEYSSPYSCVEDLLRDADTALYRAKAAGKGCIKVFNPAMHDKAVALLEWETDLR